MNEAVYRAVYQGSYRPAPKFSGRVPCGEMPQRRRCSDQSGPQCQGNRYRVNLVHNARKGSGRKESGENGGTSRHCLALTMRGGARESLQRCCPNWGNKGSGKPRQQNTCTFVRLPGRRPGHPATVTPPRSPRSPPASTGWEHSSVIIKTKANGYTFSGCLFLIPCTEWQRTARPSSGTAPTAPRREWPAGPLRRWSRAP